MKKTIKKSAVIALFAIFMSTIAFAQPPPLPGHGDDENQPAPIGSGIVILLALGAAYGSKKVYDARKQLI